MVLADSEADSDGQGRQLNEALSLSIQGRLFDLDEPDVELLLGGQAV
jgi:hypothetical protein